MKIDFVYSFYLLSIDPSKWKYARRQRYSNQMNELLEVKFVSDTCSELGSKPTFAIKPRSLLHGFYIAAVTFSTNAKSTDFPQFLEPIEIISSDLITTLGGNQTIINDGEVIQLNLYSSTTDPNTKDFDRRKLNFTFICYSDEAQPSLFTPNTL